MFIHFCQGTPLKNQFNEESEQCLAKSNLSDTALIAGEDTNHLPDIVRKYLYRTEFVDKPRIHNMKVTFEGKIRKHPNDPWMKLTACQITSFDSPTRIFYLQAKRAFMVARGLHCFKNGEASMNVKLMGILDMVNANGPLMNQSETVTHFNDMCLMAPGTLVDKNIVWEEIDPLTVKAFYTCNGITISATLYFNVDGYLENFISNDRYDLSDSENPVLREFSTPITYYMENNGNTLPQTAQAVYQMDNGQFVYGEFTIKSIEYNTNNTEFRK